MNIKMLRIILSISILFIGYSVHGQTDSEKVIIILESIKTDTPMYAVSMENKWGKELRLLIKEDQISKVKTFLTANEEYIRSSDFDFLADSLFKKFDAKYYISCSMAVEIDAENNRRMFIETPRCSAQDSTISDNESFKIRKVLSDTYITGLIRLSMIGRWAGNTMYIPGGTNRNLYIYFYAPVIE